MDKEQKMRFVWDVMNCYLDDTRSKKYLCKAKKIKTCTSMLPDSILQIYTQFMNHADDICFYQEFKIWQQKMELSTNDLLSNSRAMGSKIDSSLANQQTLLSSQESLTRQQELSKLQGQKVLDKVSQTQSDFDVFCSEVRQSFADARNETLLAFSNVQQFLDYLQRHFTSIDDIQIFFSHILDTASLWLQTFLWAVLIFFLTAIPGLSSVRFTLYLALVFSLLLRLGIRWWLSNVLSRDNVVFVENTITYSCLLISAFVSLRQDIRNRSAGEEKQAYQRMIQQDCWMGPSPSYSPVVPSRIMNNQNR